jgi:uncharacterized protein (TIGR02246 family)
MYILVMTFFLLKTFFPATLLALPASASAASVTQADPSVVEGADAYLKAMLAGDESAVVALYREDAVLMPANRPLLQGRTAIEQYYRELFQGPVKITAFTFTHLESAVSGDTAYDVGTYKQTLAVGPGRKVDDSGKYSVILKRTGGEWKIAYLIYNSDFPPKAPAAATASR